MGCDISVKSQNSSFFFTHPLVYLLFDTTQKSNILPNQKMTHPTVQSYFCHIVSLNGCFIITNFLYSTCLYLLLLSYSFLIHVFSFNLIYADFLVHSWNYFPNCHKYNYQFKVFIFTPELSQYVEHFHSSEVTLGMP